MSLQSVWRKCFDFLPAKPIAVGQWANLAETISLQRYWDPR